MTKAQAGKLGGLATLKRHGRKHMAKIGKLGAQKFHQLYQLLPLGLAHFAIVRRSDSTIVGYTSQRLWR